MEIGAMMTFEADGLSIVLRCVDGETFRKTFGEKRAGMKRGCFLAPPEDNDYDTQRTAGAGTAV